MDVIHVYWATAGNAGLYLDEIYKVLQDNKYKQQAFVNYYFPFPYGEKMFFRFTENGFTNFRNRFRLFVRFLELLYSLQKVFIYILWNRPKLVNFSLISSLWPVAFFLKCVHKIKGVRLVLTCHDVMPFQSRGNMNTSLNRMRQMFSYADYILVHTPSSIVDLTSFWGINKEVIVKHLFPILDLSRMPGFKPQSVRKTVDFLFIGYIRKEKGVDLLLEAWKIANQSIKEANLVVAGALPDWNHIDVSGYSDLNVKFELGFVDDVRYVELVQSAWFVVLPYIKGTNSGVVSTVLSLGTNIITSDITMFLENNLLNKEMMFKSGDCNSLANILVREYHRKEIHDNQNMINEYRNSFKKSVIEVYNQILN